MTTDDFASFVQHAWATHAQQPRPVAEAILERASDWPKDDTGAEALRLAEHVMLGHLGDVPAYGRLVARVLHDARPDGPAQQDPTRHDRLAPLVARDAWTVACQRARWALARLQVAVDLPPLADAPRWRAVQNVVLAEVQLGRVDAAAALLKEDEPAALSHPDPDARRAYAACANNVALELREGLRGDPARDGLMLEAAALARRAWQAAGTWLEVQRADHQLARCHAVLGQGAPALALARACVEACLEHEAPADERFFAQEAMWHAHRAAGDAADAAEARAGMRRLLDDVDDASMRDWCAQVLAEIDAEACAGRP